MSAMTKEQLESGESALMTDIWAFRKRFMNPQDDDEYWQEMTVEATRIKDKYINTDCDNYCRWMLTAITADINNRWLKSKKKHCVDFLDTIYNAFRSKYE